MEENEFMKLMESVKIGKFGLINNFLAYYKLEKDGKYEIIEADPRKLSEMMEKGEVNYAPVPSFYHLKQKRVKRKYESNRDCHKFCVASDGEIYSVVIVSKKRKLDDSPIAVTSKSVTSLNMLKIIKNELGMKNEIVVANGSVREMLKNYDHALVIGDEAIKARMTYKVVMDIGEEWKNLTNLPAVFGIAVSRNNCKDVDEDVLSSVRWGKKNMDLIIEEASLKYRLPQEFLEIYFKTLIHEIRSKERKALKVYEELCYEYKLL